MDKLAQVYIGDKFNSPFGKDKGLADLVSIILSNAIIIAGVILLFLLVFGGVSIIIGAGQNNPEAAARGRQAASAAAVGFAIIFTVYWIMQIIGTLVGFSLVNPIIP